MFVLVQMILNDVFNLFLLKIANLAEQTNMLLINSLHYIKYYYLASSKGLHVI